MPAQKKQVTKAPKAERPSMGKGYGISKDSAGMLTWKFVRDRMLKAHNYWVATARPDVRAHVMPVWGLWFDEAFCFGTDPNSVKGRNLAKNPHAVVHLESGDEVVILEGTVDMVKTPAAVKRFANEYNVKYKVRPEAGFYRLKPKVALAWREKDFPKSATRWKF